jgi:hypothetical protein
MSNAANTVATPRSSCAILRSGPGLRRNTQSWKKSRLRSNSHHNERTVPAQFHSCAVGTNPARCVQRSNIISARCQAGCLAGGIDASDLGGHRTDTAKTQQQRRNQRDDCDGSFNRGESTVV